MDGKVRMGYTDILTIHYCETRRCATRETRPIKNETGDDQEKKRKWERSAHTTRRIARTSDCPKTEWSRRDYSAQYAQGKSTVRESTVPAEKTKGNEMA